MKAAPDLLGAAHALLQAGLSVVPAKAKRPALDGWKSYQDALPIADELDEWFTPGADGIGIICGRVSGGLEVVDVDAKNDPAGTLGDRFTAALREYFPALADRLPCESTPSGGLHFYFRSGAIQGNLKLASRPKDGVRLETLIETRGEGGFIVCAPTPGYEFRHGSLSSVPMLTAEERDDLLALARAFDETPRREVEIPQRHRDAGLSPIDDFNARGDALELLRRHGWTLGSERPDGSRFLRRPDKASGWSATWNHSGNGRLCVFSSSTPFDVAPATYGPAGIFAVLECGGDFHKAAGELRRQGFGSLRVDPLADTAAPSAAPSEPRKVTPFEVWKPSDFIVYQPPAGSMLLGDGYLERGELTSLVGAGGLGKTRLATWLCLAQITGRDWCGIQTRGEPQTALFLSAENGLRRWKIDFERMLAPLSIDERNRVEAHMRVLALTATESGDLNLGDLGNVARLAATLDETNPGIVVLDPFASVVAGDENKAQDVAGTLLTLTTLLRRHAPDAAALLIHHARTGAANVAQAGDGFNAGNFGRGSKALYSRVRCELQLAPADREDPNRLVLACGKSNNGQKFETRGVIFNPETFAYEVDPSFDVDAWRSDVAGKRRDQSVTILDVVEAVKERYSPGQDVARGELIKILQTETGGAIRTIQRRIGEAVKAGYLRIGMNRSGLRLGVKSIKG